MRNNRKSAVAIVKVKNGAICDALQNLLDLLGGIESFVLPFQTVLLKPNWVTDKSYETGAVTHPQLIESCTRQVLNCGVKKVYIGDSSMVGKNTEGAIHNSGLEKMNLRRVEIIDFKKSEYKSIGISNALKYRRLAFPKELLESQVVINLPVLKTHDYLPATLGLKNMKGVLRDVDKRRFHSWGLEEGIIDTNRIALADLTIIDGIIGMQGKGPINGISANTNVLIGSSDALAAEVVALHVMGMEDVHPDYIEMAYEAGFGEKDIDNIDVIGEDIGSVRKKFERNCGIDRSLCGGKVLLSTETACSTCRFIAEQIAQDKAIGSLHPHKKMKLFFGGIKDKETAEIVLGVGNCCAMYKEKCDSFIPGCPPRKKDIVNAILTEAELEDGVDNGKTENIEGR
ncbi:hypothetical protein ADH76_06005 [Enterocloster clostridioformis]|nr:hypothetical protein A4V08_33705 [Lachnoclostridium sp. YL32]NDO28468.1 DUF362 domain-containing protein [Enterocloster clostridioformis]OXE70897.1 hypothetical protein ADH76_06005 [Enterocloster clostridioformis]QQR01054.1 DUF362 domain-containing protein [Enterocloster clostridioformis]